MTELTKTPPANPPPGAPTWPDLVLEERILLDGVIELFREKGEHPRPPREEAELVADALESAMRAMIAKEEDEEKRAELERRAAARCLARMFKRGPRLAFTRPLAIEKARTALPAAPTTKAKPAVETFEEMLAARRARRPHLVIDNGTTRPSDEVAPAA